MRNVYLDNNATTKLDAAVLDAMLPYMTEIYGNASNVLHAWGQEAAHAVSQAQNTLADCFHSVSKNDFIFTSGATESNNLAISGIIQGCHMKKPHIIVSSIEHPSILQVCRYWEQQGVCCTYLPVDNGGKVSSNDVENAIQENTVLISVMSANNEIGTIQPIEEIGEIARKRGVLFHTDATQYLYYKLIDVQKIPVDLISFSAHKIHGPKGVGGLYANTEARRRILPQILGGGQQDNLRSGTFDVAGIVGLTKAIELLSCNQGEDNQRISMLRNCLLEKLQEIHPICVNGDIKNRISNNLNIFFPGVSALQLAAGLSNVAFSMGSACSSASKTGSHVLKAIGLDEVSTKNSLRFGLSRFTSINDIEEVIHCIKKVLVKNDEDRKD